MNEKELNKQSLPSDESERNMRHSAAHLLAAAVLALYPNAKRTIGPAIDNGFYYDFDDLHINEEDLPKIEAKMSELLKDWKGFERREVSLDEAKKMYADNPYKLELIAEFAEDGKTLTVYDSINDKGEVFYSDLCKGGHSENPKQDIGAFKLLNIAGAYWRGSEKNKMLTRIYGTAWSTQKEQDEYLAMLEEAKKRDHRKLGKELDLFVFSDDVGSGLPLWTPKGATVRRELENFIVKEELKRGYQHVYTPDIANLNLYKKSGHYPYYKDSMYSPIKIDDDEYMLRPMTCPHHFELFLSKPRSYKESPIRYAELANLYRYEKSGELTGLIRVRAFTLADAHIITRKNQAEKEIHGVLDLIEYVADTFGLKPGVDYSYRLSLGNRSDTAKYYEDNAAWDHAEEMLRKVLQSRNAVFYEAEGEAAFYGPKIDIQMKNITGKEDTAFTVQYDFVMPKRFKLNYLNEKGELEEAVVVHRSSIGAIERVMAFLIERYAGAFPTWLSPIQVQIIPIADRHVDYANQLLEQLRDADIRAEVDSRSESMQSKIRDAQLQKIPYMLVVGDREEAEKQVTIRKRSGENLADQDFSKFVEDITTEIKDRKS